LDRLYSLPGIIDNYKTKIKMSYINGSDLLCSADGKAIGHATTHEASFKTETKTVAVKPAAAEAKSSKGLYKQVRVTGLSVQVTAEGLCVSNETETGVKDLLKVWKVGGTVKLNLFEREGDETPYCSGDFIISELRNTAPAGEDASYNVTFDNSGEVDIDEDVYPTIVAA